MKSALIIVLFSITTLLSGCATHTDNYTLAPEIKTELYESLWPTPEMSMTSNLQGSLELRGTVIPIQGRVLRSLENHITIALLTSFGATLLEAKISENEYQLIQSSPVISEYLVVERFLIESIRHIYLTPENCRSLLTGEIAELRCNDRGEEQLYSYAINGVQNYTLQNQYSSSIEFTYEQMSRYINITARMKRYNFILKLENEL